MRILTLVAALSAASPLRAQAPAAAAPAPAAAPAASTTTAAAAAGALAQSTATVASIYTGDRVRDPFMAASMGGGPARAPKAEKDGEEQQAVDIHALVLRGIMKDTKTDYALFSAESGNTYMLRDGKLWDDRRKRVPGVTGKIKLKQKTVELMTPDKDVQVYRLGEDDKDKEKDKS